MGGTSKTARVTFWDLCTFAGICVFLRIFAYFLRGFSLLFFLGVFCHFRANFLFMVGSIHPLLGPDMLASSASNSARADSQQAGMAIFLLPLRYL